jgi:hypothetical protein
MLNEAKDLNAIEHTAFASFRSDEANPSHPRVSSRFHRPFGCERRREPASTILGG